MIKLILSGFVLCIVLISGCVNISNIPSDCNPPFFISENENVNESVLDVDSAYQILSNIEPGWSKDTNFYKDYKNSQVTDVKFKEIPVGPGFELIEAYVLQNQTAVDSEGQIYRRGGCI